MQLQPHGLTHPPPHHPHRGFITRYGAQRGQRASRCSPAAERCPPAGAGLSPGLGSCSHACTAGAALGVGPGAARSQPRSLLLLSRERRAPAGGTGGKGEIRFPLMGSTKGKGGIGFPQQGTRRAHARCCPSLLRCPGAWDGAHPLPPPAPAASEGTPKTSQSPSPVLQSGVSRLPPPPGPVLLGGAKLHLPGPPSGEGGRNPMQPLGAWPRSAAPKINRREERAVQCLGDPLERQPGCSCPLSPRPEWPVWGGRHEGFLQAQEGAGQGRHPGKAVCSEQCPARRAPLPAGAPRPCSSPGAAIFSGAEFLPGTLPCCSPGQLGTTRLSAAAALAPAPGRRASE